MNRAGRSACESQCLSACQRAAERVDGTPHTPTCALTSLTLSPTHAHTPDIQPETRAWCQLHRSACGLGM